jgi:alpha-L-rhamnosidase
MKIDATLKKAKWIWYELHEYDLVNSWMQARRTMDLEAVPKTAMINVTADSNYRLFVNGVHVHRGPARGFQKSWPYDTIDIAPYLKKGRNIIAALVHCLGIGTFGYYHEGNAGFLLWGKIGTEDIVSDTSWKVRAAPGFVRTMTRVSLELNFQEVFDGRLDDDKWLQPEFDDKTWKTPFCRSIGCMPWPSLEQRGIPSLKEEVMVPQRIVSESSGNCLDGHEVPSNITKTYLNEKKQWTKTKLRLSFGKGKASFQVPPTGKGRFKAYCIDYGKEVVGSLALDISGSAGSEIVDTLVCEYMEKKVPIFQPITEGSRPCFGNRLYLGKGRTVHEQFDHWGQRYLVIVVRDSEAPLEIELQLNWVGYPLDIKGQFHCSDRRLERIYEMCVWSQQCCMLDAYVDCPWREQAQWWGDARVQGRNTFYLSADTRLFKRGIIQLGTQESNNGLTYGVAPTVSHRCILPDFSLVWLLTHWDYYWQTGDLSLFKQYRERIHRLLEYFKQVTARNGLIPYDNRYWLFLDWHPIFKEGVPAVYNLLYLWALRKVSDMFGLIGDRKYQREYKQRAKALEAAIDKGLWNKKAHIFYGGCDWDNKPVEKGAIHSLALGILLDLYPEHHEEWVKRHLVPMVKGKYSAAIVPSPYFMYYIFEALKKTHREEEILDCIRRWWGSMLDRGFTTTEEIWNGKPGKDSLCHAWSAHPIVHFSDILLGIWQEAPGWKKVRFSPIFTKLRSVQGKVAVPQGTIDVGWSRDRNQVKVSLSLPKGITASIDLPSVERRSIKEKGKWCIDIKKNKNKK